VQFARCQDRDTKGGEGKRNRDRGISSPLPADEGIWGRIVSLSPDAYMPTFENQKA